MRRVPAGADNPLHMHSSERRARASSTSSPLRPRLQGPASAWRENEEVLVGKKVVLCREGEARGLHLPDEVLARDLHRERGADRELALLEVDVHALATGTQHALPKGEGLRLVLDVVPGVDDHEAVDGPVPE